MKPDAHQPHPRCLQAHGATILAISLSSLVFLQPTKGSEEGEKEAPAVEEPESLSAKAARIDLSDPAAFRDLLDQATEEAPANLERLDVAESDLPETIRYSLKLSRYIDREDLAARYRQQLVERLLSLGHMQEAAQFTEEIPGYRRAITHARIAQVYAHQNEPEKAREFLARSEYRLNTWRPPLRELVMAEQAIAMAALGQFEKAETLADALNRKVPQTAARSGIAVERDRLKGEGYNVDFEMGDTKPGRPYPERLDIAEGMMKVALEELREAKTAGEDISKAQKKVQEAVNFAFLANIDISNFLVDTADALRELEEHEAANRLVDFIGRRIERLDSSAEWRNEVLARLTKHYPKEKQEEVAKALETAISQLSMFQPFARSRSIASIGKGWAEIGKPDQAREIWLQALEEVRNSQIPRNWAMVGIDVCLHAENSRLELGDELRSRIEALLVDVPAAQRPERAGAKPNRTPDPEPATASN